MTKSASFFGLGYVGLTTAACLASRGVKVTGYDVDERRVERIKGGRSPIFEPRLDGLLSGSLKSGALKLTTDPSEAVSNSDVIFVTVGTPSSPDGSVDLGYVRSAARAIGGSIGKTGGYRVVVVKSTVVPGTTTGPVREELERASGRRVGGEGFGLAMSPEFLKEGRAVDDTFAPDRLVIGEADERSGDELLELLREFYGGAMPPIVRTTPENAELIKYANNSYLAMKVGFANEMARLCQNIPGGDVDVVMKGVGLDDRIGNKFLNAGVAWGGSCFPKDLKGLAAFGRKNGVRLALVESALESNAVGPREFIDLCERLADGLKGKATSLLGLAFKPDTDDTRESPALRVAEELVSRGATVRAYDPRVKEVSLRDVQVSESVEVCLRSSELAILATEWKEFAGLKPSDFLKWMKVPLVVDSRRVYNPFAFSNGGVKLIQLGRHPLKAAKAA